MVFNKFAICHPYKNVLDYEDSVASTAGILLYRVRVIKHVLEIYYPEKPMELPFFLINIMLFFYYET